ncbi:hypothetical protein C7R92_24080 [Brevibacillus porteri]|uniref:Uncharacterized protein n=1 Tax=Brevibacillus porteri TaxID=2126350 RepID=A0ABX5FL04_9BACL|nr:hypothetical protein C7R92_24080 [Brevibacillus porteri]
MTFVYRGNTLENVGGSSASTLFFRKMAFCYSCLLLFHSQEAGLLESGRVEGLSNKKKVKGTFNSLPSYLIYQ